MSRQQIVIRQAVHGYVEGHRELWNSAQLKQRDSKSVLLYSDTSSSGLQIGEGGYLTGYPLPESGYYAFARTWPAPEMQRPGAVWTHTLFIEFSDVAKLRDATALLPLFQRPDGMQSSLGESIKDRVFELAIAEAQPLSFAADSDEVWYRQLLAGLYGSPDSKIVAVGSSDNAGWHERYVLTLWSQQWPRLRRAFRFCTLTTADRSAQKATFDLQVVPDTERGVRSKFPAAAFLQGSTLIEADWLDHLVQDFKEPGSSGLREFLQQAGADLTTGRRAFVPLTRLHMALTNSRSGLDRWRDAVDLVREVAGSENSTVTQLVLAAAVSSAPALDATGLEFVLSNLELVDPAQVSANANALGVAVWRMSPLRLAQLWESGGLRRDVARAGLDAIEEDDLLEGLPLTGQFIDTAFGERPDLLLGSAVWGCEPALVMPAIHAAALRSDITPHALDQLITVQKPGLIASAFAEFGHDTVWRHLATALASKRHPMGSLSAWLQAGTAYPGAIAQVLSAGDVLNRSALFAIAQSSHPDLVPNEYGDDPWVIAVNRAITGGIADEEVYLCSYLLARAFGPRSRNVVGLIELALSVVSSAVTRQSLPDSAWQMLAPQLPESQEWPSWDRRLRLLAGVGQLYVRKSLSAASFGRLGGDAFDFKCIVSAAAKEWGGRSYLKGVRREFRTSHDFARERREIVEDAIGSWF